MSELINVGFVVNAVVFAFLGVFIFWVSFVVIDRLTPYQLWREIVDEHNFALAIVVGAMSLGVCIIIAAAIHA
jgi:putative membrane protein